MIGLFRHVSIGADALHPVVWVDPSGLYYMGNHQDLARKGYNRSSVSTIIPSGADIIAAAGAAPDEQLATLGRAPHFSGGQYADDMMHAAVDAYLAGDYAGALGFIGNGSHAIADSFSHVGAAETPKGHIMASKGARKGECPDPDDPATNWGAYSNAAQAITDYFNSFGMLIGHAMLLASR